MKKRNGLFYFNTLSVEETEECQTGSAAELIQEIVQLTPVVSAFQAVPAVYLSNVDSVMNIDIMVAGNNDAAVCLVSKLIRDIPNLRPLKVDPLENSKCIESITPLLLNALALNRLQ